VIKKTGIKNLVFWSAFLFWGLQGCGEGNAVARVNGAVISLEQLDRQVLIYTGFWPELEVNENLKIQLLQQMIKQELLVQEAIRRGFDQETETAQKIKEKLLSSRQELLENITRMQAQLDQLEKATQASILIDRLLLETSGQVSASKDEIKELYQSKQKAGQKLGELKEVEARLDKEIRVEKLVANLHTGAKVEVYREKIHKH
jgi:hypothetical protein